MPRSYFIYPTLLVLALSLSVSNCITSKVCSEQDRGCSLQASLVSFFSTPPGIYLYGSLNSYQGNVASLGPDMFGGLRNICSGERILAQTVNLTCANVLPFASSDTLTLANYAAAPNNFFLSTFGPVYGAKGEIISADWNSFISVAINRSLADSGVTSDEFWTFAASAGTYNGADNCTNGTDTGTLGTVGDPFSTVAGWYGGSTTPICSEAKKIVCICY
ncbi:hypothetical protein EHQ27_19270 [Leptospira wolffii]|uniref:hypothetical protein n=1 Tax=Leptospira wolffii TaxID=409998 RepID=UPI001082BCD4|nr:hypothetical protein [Leptospira wolffii]TGK62685.1 hypothetical protein EHQ32_07710 [Leptospira wolffii]TGK65659.1 hypothetical protein EHQ27_19270 [Leptospira wolffii]TGK73928.1 hypothetical protein EHQ35_06055 [Leptospira wolffii]TGL28790.1 hypothetical protein EHQ57_12580 [Leptospira wolffii]